MTVTEVIGNFRVCLLGLLPSVEQVRIPWARPDAYDDWDRLASAAYQSLVVEVLRWGVPEALQSGFKIPPYDLMLESYAGLNLIEVLPADDSGPLHVFHSLGTVRGPFDTVETRLISADGAPLSEDLDSRPYDTARFVLRPSGKDRLNSPVEEVVLRDK